MEPLETKVALDAARHEATSPELDRRMRAAEHGAERASLSLGRWLGVEVRVDASLLLIFALLMLDLGYRLLPSWHPEWSGALRWTVATWTSLLFFVSVLLHELSHALVARTQGVTVRRITLFLFGGMAHLESEPTSARAELLMTIVGPLTSFVIGVAASWAGAALAVPSTPQSMDETVQAIRSAGPVATLLLWLGPINITLALFNLLPGFPLDGGRVLRALVWWATGDFTKATRWATTSGRIVAWSLMGLGAVTVLRGSLLQGLWLVLIGWFLNSAAISSYQRLLVTRALRGVSVARVMRTELDRLPPQLSVEALVRDHLIASDQHGFPIEVGGELAGLVTRQDVRKLPHDAWPRNPIASIMTPVEQLTTLPPEAAAERALQELSRLDVDQIPVVDHGHLIGMVMRRDLLKWVALRGAAV